MPKNKDHQPEANDVVVRIRMTQDLADAFSAYCEHEKISDASGGRLAIWKLIRESNRLRTGELLPKPDVTDRAWGKRAK